MNWFKKLFCKHEYTIEIARQWEPTEISETEIGSFIESKYLLGVVVRCLKCGKERRRIAKFIQKCEARKMMAQMENQMENCIKEVEFKIGMPERFRNERTISENDKDDIE